MEADTDSLRKAAPNWTLAGDKQLLGMLQQIHQSIMTKCQEANTKLDAMVNALDSASIDLQNVNNKFMALSNSQFVESRVYDDDVDIKVEEIVQKQESPQVPAESEIQKIKRCLQELEMMHEPVLIMDSDSSDDEESSTVLKPKDMYAHRPLPHVIGSQAWLNKWHAGLLPEDSDSESSSSKRDDQQDEEYSDSEPEIAVDATDKHAPRTISSSSVESEILSRSSQPVASPAEVAAELARRLAGPPQLPAVKQTLLPPPEPTTRIVYGMDKPTPAMIFPSEPPPLDVYQSDESSDEDIFAGLQKSNQNSHMDSRKSNFSADIVDELFGDQVKDIGNLVIDYGKPNSSVIEDSSLFDEVLPTSRNNEKTNKPTPTDNFKSMSLQKPVGGISLFGSNKGAESIGAAILKRNQRKSTSEEEGSDITDTKTKPTTTPTNKKIIEDLFTKPVVKPKDIKTKNIDSPKFEDKVETKPKDKIDLFSDNLFDDIDDIFTTNVAKPKDKNAKSIFDDDDLFVDVVEQTDRVTNKKDTKPKSIFDSDDDLFNDNNETLRDNEKTSNIKPIADGVSKINENKKNKSIFDDNSDDDLFTDINITKSTENKPIGVTEDVKQVNNYKDIKNSLNTDINEINPLPVTNKNDFDIKSRSNNNIKAPNQFQSPNIFDDDGDDDLFGINTEQNVKTLLKTQEIPKNNEKEHNIDNRIDEINNSKNEFDDSDILESSKEITKEVMKDKETSIKKIVTSTINNENIVDNSFKNINIVSHEVEKVREEKTETNVETAAKFTKDEAPTEKKPLVPDNVVAESKEPDIFSDIFNDLPPAFEKPIEAKRSKNVNALFDDDSDDEALFFKKNDVISDEKPDLDYSGDRFRIFRDEPPDIDVDFLQKPLKTDNVSNDRHIDDLFSDGPPIDSDVTEHRDEISIRADIDELKIEPVKTVDITKLLEDIDGNSLKSEVNISKHLEVEKEGVIVDKDTNLKSDYSKVEQKIQNIEQKTDESEIQYSEDDTRKSIGKLKPMNFNINVNTLLPGSSPKKTKLTEELDGQIISTPNFDISSDNLNISESKITKSVSFEGDPDSEILDNKLSKGRAKIQVKRRPSTRRARLEAVRKSGIEFGSDSTDNSSSFDEPKNKINIKDKDGRTNERTTEKLTNTDERDLNIEQKPYKTKPEIKSKVVYILNDEDIFTDTRQSSKTNNVLTNTSKDNTKTDSVKDRKPLFDDLSDEELFGKTPVQKTKESLFDSDSDEELFGKRKRSVQQKQETAGTSLFVDDSDDDDLFSNKKKSSDIKSTPKLIQPTNKATEPVFEDPLSMLGGNES